MMREDDDIGIAAAKQAVSTQHDDAARAAAPPRNLDVPTVLQAVQAPMPALGSPLAETSKLDLAAVAAADERGRLPFVQAQPPSPSGAVAASSDLKSTADPDTRAIMSTLTWGPLPFARPEHQPAAGADVDFSLLPLETYASVSGALARGEPRAETFARHNVSPETFERLARAWARRFQDEPHLLTRFRTLAKGSA